MNKTCIECNKDFNVKPSHMTKRVCCSISCMASVMKKNVGSLNNNWRGGISKSDSNICTFCSNKFSSTSYHPNKFCSRICYTKTQALDKKQRELKIKISKEIAKQDKIKSRLNKYYCKKCLSTDINRKSKYCKPCSKSKSLNDIICQRCQKKITVKKWANKKFCSMACTLSHRSGSLNSNYRGGITPENKKIRASPEYKAWRISVFERDKYHCVICNKHGGVLHADHIKQFAFFPELRLDINNGRTLCVDCHKNTPTFLNNKKTIYI